MLAVRSSSTPAGYRLRSKHIIEHPSAAVAHYPASMFEGPVWGTRALLSFNYLREKFFVFM